MKQSKESTPVTVEGRERVAVSGPSDFPRATRTCTVECASGERDTDRWTGVPVAALVEAADFPGGTTHLRAEADDFAAEVPIRAALDGILAFERGAGGRAVGDRVAGDRTAGDRAAGDWTGLPRLVADGVPGERLVKRVRRVSAVELDPCEDPRVG